MLNNCLIFHIGNVLCGFHAGILQAFWPLLHAGVDDSHACMDSDDSIINLLILPRCPKTQCPPMYILPHPAILAKACHHILPFHDPINFNHSRGVRNLNGKVVQKGIALLLHRRYQ